MAQRISLNCYAPYLTCTTSPDLDTATHLCTLMSSRGESQNKQLNKKLINSIESVLVSRLSTMQQIEDFSCLFSFLEFYVKKNRLLSPIGFDSDD